MDYCCSSFIYIKAKARIRTRDNVPGQEQVSKVSARAMVGIRVEPRFQGKSKSESKNKR